MKFINFFSLTLSVICLLHKSSVSGFFSDSPVHYEYHLQCDENESNPKTSTCTFSDVKGDQNTIWHYEPAQDTRWTYKIKPALIQRVIFANCHFPEIPKGLFNYFVNVKSVIARQGGIIGIWKYTFRGAKYLERLELAYNNITTIDDKIFSECSNLIYLDLSSNQIENIGEFAFFGLNRLKTLDLQWNKVKILYSSVFSSIVNIEVIMLNDNYLKEINDLQLSQNKKLSHIDLSNNEIQNVNDKCFEQLSNFTILNLANNKIQEFKLEFFEVKTLYLKNNILEIVYIFNNVESLDLTGNYLRELKFKPGVQMKKLVVQNNSLTDVSSIVNLSTLKELDLSINSIGQTITEQMFSKMINLESLTLSYCGLKRLPKNIFANLKKLKLLDISGNHLGYFDTSIIAHMPSIQGLYLDGNDLEEFNFNAIKHKFNNFSEIGLADNNFDCNYLKHLIGEIKKYHIHIPIAEPAPQGPNVDYIQCMDTSNAKLLKCNPEQLSNKLCKFENVQGGLREHYRYEIVNIEITQIEYITFYKSQIEEIPKGIFRTFTHVKYFTVSECYIVEIYEYTFAGAIYLLIIDLSNNQIRELRPQIFIECMSVTEINLANNEITYIDENAFEGLGQLKELHLGGNKITQLNPKVFFYLIEISYIELDRNQIENLDENIFENNRQLREVNLSKNKLKSIPKQIFKYVIEEVTLIIEYNYIQTFTEEIPNVKKMYLTGNEINELRIPKNIQQLKLENNKINKIIITEETVITELVLKNNSLKDISNLGKLKNLEILDLSYNDIQYLNPQVFEQLRKLKTLRLHKCQITSIEVIIFTYFPNLEVLDLSGNQLENFDLQQLSPLQHLETLNLEFCGLSKLNTQAISSLPALKEIAIAGNNWDCDYLRNLVVELQKQNIKRYVMDPVVNGSHVEGIGCIEGLGQQMPPDVELIDQNNLQSHSQVKPYPIDAQQPYHPNYGISSGIPATAPPATNTYTGQASSGSHAFSETYSNIKKPDWNGHNHGTNSQGQERFPSYNSPGPDVPPGDYLTSNDKTNSGHPQNTIDSCCLSPSNSGNIPTCCEDIVEIRAKVKQLEQEIIALRESTKREVTILMDQKSAQIETELKAMVQKLINNQNTADAAHLHSRFMFQESK